MKDGKDLEAILRKVVRKYHMMYPELEWEELEGQAWLILSENIEKYDKDRGVLLTTYAYNVINGELSKYISRHLIKENTLGGNRVYPEEDIEIPIDDVEAQVESKMILEDMLEESSGIKLKVLKLMLQGFTQSEVARKLKVSRQRVHTILEELRRDYGD